MGRGLGPGTFDPRGDLRRGGRTRGSPHRDPSHSNIDESQQQQQQQLQQHQQHQQQQQQQHVQQQGNQQIHTQQQSYQQMHHQPQKPPQQQKPLKGIPAVVPDFVIPNNKESPTQPQTSSTFLPQAPNIMGKLSELTSSGSGAVEAGADLLSKGKELIFMKFGLGGK
ncbi:hypothetical protein Phum_PHUM240790 [Pediculus humanus corporis]|uniref:Uncharacterized protein n=1 Tax=Pediculus humanus subsp. corporis TaxID=121224 RepID=E0VJ99_PEDHC|nr:uncharacterized protein Phum_PHUM240790 [Pediculus humanus corporis]EEB13455.1 hypothetical protein Phum_PHUM240790 [Pediculus humanus corporis]